MDELELCPFCGGEGKIHITSYRDGVDDFDMRCDGCDYTISLTAWNRRDTAQVDAQLTNEICDVVEKNQALLDELRELKARQV